MPHDILSNEQLEELLEELIGVVLSSRRTADDIAAQLAVFPRTQQDFVLRWVKVVAASNAELAYQFAQRAAAALTRANTADIEAWAVHAMDVFDRGGLHAAVAHLNDFEAFIHQRKIMAAGLPFNEVVGVLRNFLQGLPGRTLKLDSSAQVYTDTESVFLAPVAGLFQSREDNFRWYKACAVAMWAQSYYGTWNVAWNEVIARYPDPQRALCALHALELVRLDACLARDLPGVHRDMMRLRTLRTETLDLTFDPALMAQLRMQHTSVTDSLSLLPQAYAAAWRVSVCYQGEMLPERVMATRAARIAREKNALCLALAKLSADAQRPATKPIEMGGDSAQPQRFRAVRSAPEAPDDFTFELQLDGQPMIPPDDVQSLVASIIQDLGQVPEDYLVAAGDGPYDAAHQAAPRDPRDVWKGTYHEEGAHFYPEWDCERQQYRKNWAVLRELDGHPLWDDFPARTLRKYHGVVRQLRRSFEALRGDEKVQKRQSVGDDVDIDALVEATVDTHSGLEMSERLFLKRHKVERDIAVMFMVDMSGSTKGWINDAEREALLLLCEALQSLGDRYAIYGFTSLTHKRCEVVRIKRFDEAYSETVQARIAGITPQDYTRMGAPIRHLSKMLGEVDARIKLLITISDGKPDDFDVYRGRYGIEDTRQALIEARRAGAHVFCITIDTEAKEYLPHMYGAANFVVVDHVAKLPQKLSDIYRKLTA